MKKKKILIVEDDSFIRDIYQVRFSQEDFEVVATEDGIVAIEKLKEFTPDIILLDIIMPMMDGLDVLREIKKEDRLKDIPVIMLTNISEKESVDEGREIGANDYLIKSNFTPSEVVSRVKILLKM